MGMALYLADLAGLIGDMETRQESSLDRSSHWQSLLGYLIGLCLQKGTQIWVPPALGSTCSPEAWDETWAPFRKSQNSPEAKVAQQRMETGFSGGEANPWQT